MKKVLFCLAAFSLSSCAVMIKVPLNRLDSPETTGKYGKAHMMAGYQGRNELELTPAAGFTSPSLSRPDAQPPGHRLIGNGQLGVGEKLDVSFTLPQSRLGVKYQILGQNQMEAEAGNIPLAATTSISYASEKEDTYYGKSSLNLREIIYDVALISGYRVNKDWLIYGGPFVLWNRIRSSYRGNSLSASIDEKGTLRSVGANLGAEYTSNQIFLRAEYAGTKTKLGQSNSGRATYGLAFGVRL